MSFSCTIKAGKKELTGFNDSKKEVLIHCQLFGLGPNSPESTEAPNRLEDFRAVVANWGYTDSFPKAASDCFRRLQYMARENLNSLKVEKHCESCMCDVVDVEPNGWSTETIKTFLEIPAETVTYISGRH